ncbi:MAG TPA: tripartite tricarboxylate transporter substrate-binding protein [Pelagibacterium sp.]|uniref:Bug family tripartite tricarboxylate transporter substrate binding protein n=1 Tax=Pelagibacterium sp. TaxID=1967288 RepID=UPI002CB6AD3B|nr:tripartite tricarboxylate transporter substrate-binding protein [Pelagibacterium sp.]HWJ87957.1 tripartite tricarboxylate transporter substrate-binding protein [Pelagibacterium sp.]
MTMTMFASRRGVLAGLAVSLCATLAPVSGALAQDAVADFYRGKTVTIYVGFGPGGGYDLYGRLASDYLGQYIPGNPDVIVENMPGAGGRLAAQYLYAVAPKDGTALSVVVQSVAMDSATGAIPGNIDAARFNAIGRMTANYELGITWHTTGIETFDDTLTTPVAFASTGAGSASAFVPLMLNDLEGTQYKIIQGYEGVASARLALESGEVDAMMAGLAGLQSSNPEWINDGIVNVIWQLSTAPHPDFPDVPAIGQLGETEDEQAMFRLVAGAADIGRALITTPDVPQDRVDALRAAFDAMAADPAFIEAAAQRNLDLDILSGAALQEVIHSQMDVSDEAIDLTRSYVLAQ